VDELLIGFLIGALLTAGFGRAFFISRFDTYRKKVGTLTLTVLAVVLLLTPALADAGAWTFAVVGDSRGKSAEKDSNEWHFNPKREGKYYKNWDYLWRIAKDISTRKCDLVIFTGDLICGGGGNHAKQYENWKKAMQPVFNANIPVYPVRGNHEEWGDPNATQWKTFVTAHLKNLPQNGPDGEKSCTYSFFHKNAFFVALDEYFHRSGKKHKINQAWLNAQLQNNNRNTHPHVFVYAHTPAFKVSHSSGSTGALYDDSSVRHTLWISLRDHGVRAYFCGHIHFYTANRIKGYGSPELYQICNGIGGAGLDAYKGDVDKDHVIYGTQHAIVEAKNIGGHHGYNLVHVDGNKVTIDLRAWHNTEKFWETKKGIYEGSYTVR